MKKNLIFLLVFWCFLGNAQRIKFNYDSAGNQTKRFICLCAAKTDNDSIYKTPETITENDLIKDDIISYYPNPVREELYLKWSLVQENYVSMIEVYSMTGQLMKNYSNLKELDKTAITFHDYPDGFYNLIMVYGNGDRKTLKIVKK